MCIFCGTICLCGINQCIHSYGISHRKFYYPKNHLCSTCPSISPTETLGKHWSFCCCWMSYSYNWTVCSHFWLASLTWQHTFIFPSWLLMAGKLISFGQWIIILLTGCATIYLYIQLFKGILVDSKFLTITNKCAINIVFSVD